MRRFNSIPGTNGTCPREPASNFTLLRDAWGRLTLTDSRGQRHLNVRIIPLFPISDPRHWVSVCDANGRELAFVTDPELLPPAVGAIIKEEITRREFLPEIRRIVHVSGKGEPCEWLVDSDRGRTRFVLQREDDVRRLADNKVSVTDSNGIRYLIENVQRLDRKSRRIIEWYV
jgi:Domain of unknown function (DUF1854)